MNTSQALHDFLSEFSKNNKINKYMEIGTREGDSLVNVINNNTNIDELLLCDTWGGLYGGSNRKNHSHIEQLLAKYNFTGKVRFLDGDSKVTVPSVAIEYQNFFDLILVDGDHSYDGGMIDLKNVIGLCKSGGTIVFDDIIHPQHKYLESCFDKFVEDHLDIILKHNKEYNGYGIGTITKK
jgi:predicted O-methyltransferase YrrM